LNPALQSGELQVANNVDRLLQFDLVACELNI